MRRNYAPGGQTQKNASVKPTEKEERKKTHRNLLLRARHIRKISARLRRLARRVPLPLDHMHLRPVLRRHRRLERVRLAGEVALAFVLDLLQRTKIKSTLYSSLLLSISITQPWCERPELFAAIADGKTPEERHLAVLKWFIVRFLFPTLPCSSSSYVV